MKSAKTQEVDPVKARKILKYKNVWLICGLISASFFIILVIGWLRPDLVSPRVENIVFSLFNTMVSILVINLMYQKLTEDETEETINKVIFDTLKGDEVELKRHSDDSIKGILWNCTKVLMGNELSREFYNNVVDKQLRSLSYRKEFMYDTLIVSGRSSGDGADRIEQSLSYRKFIKQNRQEIKLSVMFSLVGDAFAGERKVDGNEIFFFREELINSALIEKVRAIIEDTSLQEQDAAEAVAEVLGIRIGVMALDNRSCNRMPVMRMRGDDQYVVLSTFVPIDCIREEPNGYISFKASINCRYEADIRKYYYCVFPEPTFNAEVNVQFSGFRTSDIRTIEFLQDNNYAVTRHNDTFTFKRTDNSHDVVIFPHSGIVFHWDNA